MKRLFFFVVKRDPYPPFPTLNTINKRILNKIQHNKSFLNVTNISKSWVRFGTWVEWRMNHCRSNVAQCDRVCMSNLCRTFAAPNSAVLIDPYVALLRWNRTPSKTGLVYTEKQNFYFFTFWHFCYFCRVCNLGSCRKHTTLWKIPFQSHRQENMIHCFPRWWLWNTVQTLLPT